MKHKFLNFINNLIDGNNTNSINTIKRGFRTIFESYDDYMTFDWGKTPRDVFNDQFEYYTTKDGGNGFYYMQPGDFNLSLLNKIKFDHEMHVGNKIAFTKDTLWDLLKKMESYETLIPLTLQEMLDMDMLRQEILLDLRIDEN